MARYKNDKIIVDTPRGQILERVYTKGKNKGRVYLRMEWKEGFGPDWTKHLQGVQAMFDQEVLRVTEPYVPMNTGLLRRSAQMASNIGGGELDWSTPYAAVQYYGTSDSRSYSPLAGGHWGERMKADRLPQLEKFVKGAACKK